MEIIPPEAAHVMSLASVDPGSGSLMPVNSALPGSAPMLVVSPAIVGREDDEKTKGNPKTAEVPSESSSNIEKEIESARTKVNAFVKAARKSKFKVECTVVTINRLTQILEGKNR